MHRSADVTAMCTVNSPASRLLLQVMYVVEKITMTIRPVNGEESEGPEAAGDEEDRV